MPIINLNPIRLTIQELLNNPSGKGSHYGAKREFIKNDLNARYKKLILKHKKFKYTAYKVKEDFYIWFKIPSETYDDLYYDVIIQFCPEDAKAKLDGSLNRYYLRLFSNSPAFMFTYTYVVNQNNMLAVGTKKFCAKKALNSPPKVTNPVEVYGFEKSIYFACLYIMENKLNQKFIINRNIYLLNKKLLEQNLTTQEQKLIEYKKKKAETEKAKRQEKIEKTKKINEALQKRNSKITKRNTNNKKTKRPNRIKRK